MVVRESARHEAAALLACDPSWAEAMAKATEVLRGFDPKIAKARGSLCGSVKPRQVRVRAQGIYRPIGLGVLHPVISIVEAGQQRYASALGRGPLVF